MDAAYARNIAEEIAHFEQEMASHRKFLAELDSLVGEPEERRQLASRAASSAQFQADVKSSMKVWSYGDRFLYVSVWF